MADMINHSAEPNAEISFDTENNCYVTAITDVYAGSPLSVSLGDPTDPTPIFAKYGFLPTGCNTIFCKAIDLETQINELGYEFNQLLFRVTQAKCILQYGTFSYSRYYRITMQT